MNWGDILEIEQERANLWEQIKLLKKENKELKERLSSLENRLDNVINLTIEDRINKLKVDRNQFDAMFRSMYYGVSDGITKDILETCALK